MAKSYEKIWQLILNGYSEEIIVFPIIGYHSAYINNIKFSDYVKDPRTMAEIQYKTFLYYGSDFIAPVMDLTVEAEAIGATVSWNSIPPSIDKHISIDKINNIVHIKEDFLFLGRIPIFTESIKILREINKDNKILCGYITGPFTLAGNLFGHENILKYVLKNPQELSRIVNILCDFLTLYSKALIENGAECIIIADPLSALISPQHYNIFSLEALRVIVNEIKKRNKIAVLHTCGNAIKILKHMAETGAHILSIDKYIDIKTAITTVDKVIMGNIPTALFLSNPEKVKEYTLEILSISKGYRHIVASGCEIPPYANPECIKEMVKAARSFNTMILRR